MKSAVLGAVITATAIAGCGSTKTVTVRTQAPTRTLAHVCKSHPKDLGSIAGGLFAFKESMDMGDTSALFSVSDDLQTAVSDLQTAADGTTSSAQTRAFWSDLDDLSNFVQNPPKYPTAYAGDQDAHQVASDARAVGCDIGKY